MKKIIKKADIVLFIVLILLGGVLSLFAFRGNDDVSTVVIKVDGKVYGTYPLNQDRTIVIENNGHINKVNINEGKVQMLEANCHNQLCVRQGAINQSNQPIVCLPNRVVVEIVDGEEDYDVILG